MHSSRGKSASHTAVAKGETTANWGLEEGQWPGVASSELAWPFPVPRMGNPCLQHGAQNMCRLWPAVSW